MLKNRRIEKNLTFEQIEKGTKIRKKYLYAIENEQWDKFPSLTYILGTIKNYGSFLSLPEDKLMAFFRREYESAKEDKFSTRLPSAYFSPKTKKVIGLVLGAILILFLVYFSYQIYLYFLPPKVTILQPNKTIFYTEKVKLVGSTIPEAIVFINGQRVYLDKQYHFNAQISLVSKKTAVTIEVTGPNGRKTTLFKVFEKR